MNFQNYLWWSNGITSLLKKNIKGISTASKNFEFNNIIFYTDPPYYYVITYKQLANDLVGFNLNENDRTKLLKNIMEHTDLKNGSILVPIYNDGQTYFDLIYKLKESHKICCIILFGFDTKDIILDLDVNNYGLYFYKGCRVLVLPSLDKMLPNNKFYKNITWSFLRNLSKIRG